MASSRVESNLSIENGALVWRVAGARGRSAQGKSGGKRTPKHIGKNVAAHWGQAARIRKQDREFWQTLLIVAGNRNDAPVAEIWDCPRPAHIWIRVYGHPLPDSCNVADYHKYAIDALVALGYIADDAPKYAPWTHAGAIAERPDWLPTGVGVEIRLEAA